MKNREMKRGEACSLQSSWTWLAPICLTIVVGLCSIVALIFDARLLELQKSGDAAKQVLTACAKENMFRRVELQRLSALSAIEQKATMRFGMVYPESRVPLFPQTPLRLVEKELPVRMAQTFDRPRGNKL